MGRSEKVAVAVAVVMALAVVALVLLVAMVPPESVSATISLYHQADVTGKVGYACLSALVLLTGPLTWLYYRNRDPDQPVMIGGAALIAVMAGVMFTS